MSEHIDFTDTDLVQFDKVKPGEKLEGFVSDIDKFTKYYGIECEYDVSENLSQVYTSKIAGHLTLFKLPLYE